VTIAGNPSPEDPDRGTRADEEGGSSGTCAKSTLRRDFAASMLPRSSATNNALIIAFLNQPLHHFKGPALPIQLRRRLFDWKKGDRIS
jgi:hypothetical protein